MIELRWKELPNFKHTEGIMWRDSNGDSKPVTLQYRIAVAVDASGALCPGPISEWLDAPYEPF